MNRYHVYVDAARLLIMSAVLLMELCFSFKIYFADGSFCHLHVWIYIRILISCSPGLWDAIFLWRSFGETQRVLVSIYRYCFIKADMMPFGGWVEQRETIEWNDSRCLSFLRNSPPAPPISRPTSPLSLSLSLSISLSLSLSYLHLPPPVR